MGKLKWRKEGERCQKLVHFGAHSPNSHGILKITYHIHDSVIDKALILGVPLVGLCSHENLASSLSSSHYVRDILTGNAWCVEAFTHEFEAAQRIKSSRGSTMTVSPAVVSLFSTTKEHFRNKSRHYAQMHILQTYFLTKVKSEGTLMALDISSKRL